MVPAGLPVTPSQNAECCYALWLTRRQTQDGVAFSAIRGDVRAAPRYRPDVATVKAAGGEAAPPAMAGAAAPPARPPRPAAVSTNRLAAAGPTSLMNVP